MSKTIEEQVSDIRQNYMFMAEECEPSELLVPILRVEQALKERDRIAREEERKRFNRWVVELVNKHETETSDYSIPCEEVYTELFTHPEDSNKNDD